MLQYDYYLSYINIDKDGNEYYEDIDLSDIDFLKTEDKNSLKRIDEFTSHFKDAKELSLYLKHEGITDSDVDEFIITLNKNSSTKDQKKKKLLEKNIPVSGRKIIYLKDKYKVSSLYITEWLTNSENADKVIAIMDLYSAPIKDKESRRKKVYEGLKHMIQKIKNSDMADEGYVLVDKLRGEAEKFIKTLIEPSKDSNSYKEMRDFIFFISRLEGEIKTKEKKHTDNAVSFEPDEIKFKYGNYDHEEFITRKEDEKARRM